MILNAVVGDEAIEVGTYTYRIPARVTAISAVAIGCGGDMMVSLDGASGGGGGGGALAYRNSIPVTPGEVLWVRVQRNSGGVQSSTELRRGSASGELLLQAGNGQDAQNGTAGALTAAGGIATAITGAVTRAGGAGRRWQATTRGNGGGAGTFTAAGAGGALTTGADGAGTNYYGTASGAPVARRGGGVGGAQTGPSVRPVECDGAVYIVFPGSSRLFPSV